MASLDFDRAKELGIVAPYAKGFMAFDSMDGKIRLNANKTYSNMKLAMDAALTTVPNVGLPPALFQFINPEIVPILFAVNNATKLFAERKVGDWTTDFQQFPVEEIAGSVNPYDDYDAAVSTDVNYEFPSRENFRFQTAIKYGDLETEKAAVAKIALVARKQRAAAAVIAKAANRFYLFGVQNKRIYGALNDPNLNDTVAPISVGGKSTWAGKIADAPQNAANIVFADIAALVTELMKKTGGHVDQNSPMKLGISNGMASYLTYTNTYGKTAKEMLAENYPNLEIVTIPELSTNEGEILYLAATEVEGISVADTAYAEKYRLSRVVPETTSFKQKAMSSTFGAVIKQPAFIARMKGI